MSRTILIAESGSTKTEWHIVVNNKSTEDICTSGINPFMQDDRAIEKSIRSELPLSFFEKDFDFVYFYGAGCATLFQKGRMARLLHNIFTSESEVESDLCASAHALFGKDAGIACILGTGSNSCFYDGRSIVKNVPSLGYILGDEGSGAALGRMFLADCLKGLAPKRLADDFFLQYSLNYENVLECVYQQPFPNRFLGQFTHFLNANKHDEYVQKLLRNSFEQFFRRNISQYEYKKYPVGFVGSVAFYFDAILQEVASDWGIDIQLILKSPTEWLVRYHSL